MVLRYSILALVFLFGCKQKSEKTVRTRILSPTQDTVYYQDKIPIKALIDDPLEVHTITIELKIMPQDSSVFYIYLHDHQKEIKIDTIWHNKVGFDTEMLLYLVAYNHNNDVDTSKVIFYNKKER